MEVKFNSLKIMVEAISPSFQAETLARTRARTYPRTSLTFMKAKCKQTRVKLTKANGVKLTASKSEWN